MIARRHVKTPARWLVGTLSGLLAVFVLSGCEMEGYPEHLTYPLRSDPLVNRSKTVEKDAPGYDKPGVFPNRIFVGLTTQERQSLLVYPANMNSEQSAEIQRMLKDLFGSPARPKVSGVDEQFAKDLKLDEKTLARGSEHYRHQCLHCHGLTGDGRGPTAPWVNPHPRDYRQGIFKFTSSSQSEGERKPRRDDLLRTLREGIEGTSMPSFRLLPDEDLEALASYVIHLSLRGETEFRTIMQTAKADSDQDETIEARVKDALELLARYWQKAQSSMIQPGSYQNPSEEELKASIQRGFDLFSRAQAQGDKKSAGCLGCHLDYGRQSAYKYDYWGTIVRPADLTTGLFRGGRRPLDLYNRIHSGVNGVTMPASGRKTETDPGSGNLGSQDIWDIVNFLQILPYPKMREKYGIQLEESK